MKYLSVLFFTLAFVWTWNAVTSIPPVGMEIHSGIQASMADLIDKSVAAKKPGATNLVIQRMKTQEGENGEVNVFFQYKFDEPDAEGGITESQISGVATLKRSETPDENGRERWVLQTAKTTNETLSFEPLRVTPGNEENPAPPAPETTPPAEAPAEAAPGSTGP